MDEVMVVTGLVGALVASSYKWGYFVFAMFALFFIAYNVCYVGLQRKSVHFTWNSALLILQSSDAKHHGGAIHRTYLLCGVWTISLWFIYPIAWGLCEGGNVISPDSEAVFYGVLDTLAKPVFGALLLWGHRKIDPALLDLHIKEYDDAVNSNEKNGFPAAAVRNNNNNNGGVINNRGAATGVHHHNHANPAIDGTSDAPVSTGVNNSTSNV